MENSRPYRLNRENNRFYKTQQPDEFTTKSDELSISQNMDKYELLKMQTTNIKTQTEHSEPHKQQCEQKTDDNVTE